MSNQKPDKPIPKAILAPLAKYIWKCDGWSLGKFASLIESHAKKDEQDGCTVQQRLPEDYSYHLSATITATEFAKMVKQGAVRPEFHRQERGGSPWVNQHWLHSLEQFYAEVIVAWHRHLERTDALIGTPAGRIRRGRDDD